MIAASQIYDMFTLEECIDFLIARVNRINQNKSDYSAACWHYSHKPCPFHKEHNLALEEEDDIEEVEDLNPHLQHPSNPQQVRVTPSNLDQAIDQEDVPVYITTKPKIGRPQGYTHSNPINGPVVRQVQQPTNSIMVPRIAANMIEVVERKAPEINSGPITYSTQAQARLEKRAQKQGGLKPIIHYQNEVIDLPLSQSFPGLFPPKNLIKINKVVGNPEFVVVKKPFFANPNHSNINGLIYQDKTYGRFYTAGGQSIKTDKSGYIITYVGKGARPYPVIWKNSDPSRPSKKELNKPTKAISDAFAHRDTLLKKYNLKSEKNTAWRSGSKDPKQFTIDLKTNNLYKPGTYQEYDEFLQKLHLIIKEERGKKIKIRKEAIKASKSSSPKRLGGAQQLGQQFVIKNSSRVIANDSAKNQSPWGASSGISRRRRKKHLIQDAPEDSGHQTSDYDYKVTIGGISYSLTKEEYDANLNWNRNLGWKSSSKKKVVIKQPLSQDLDVNRDEEKMEQLPEEESYEPWLHSVQHSEISQNRPHGVAFDDFGLMTQHHYVRSSHPANLDKH
jgi:hypothetical protein